MLGLECGRREGDGRLQKWMTKGMEEGGRQSSEDFRDGVLGMGSSGLLIQSMCKDFEPTVCGCGAQGRGAGDQVSDCCLRQKGGLGWGKSRTIRIEEKRS